MCAPAVYRYRPRELIQLRARTGYPPPQVIGRLKKFHLFRNRGCKAGRNVQRPIKALKPSTVPRKRHQKPTEKRVVKEVPRLWYSLPSVLLANVTSLCNKLDEVSATVKALDVGVVAITEAWQIVPEISAIEGYDLFYQLREDKRGGGVALYIREELCAFQPPVTVPEGVEALWVRLTPPSHPRLTASMLVCVIYHAPRAPSGQALSDHIISTADTLRGRYPSAKLVVCGDFNELDISDITEQLHLTQVVDFPTHGQNTLDLILTDLSDQYLPPQPLPPMGRSPHITVLWSPSPTTAPPHSTSTHTYRPTPDSAIREFGRWITSHQWMEVLTEEDVDAKWEKYVHTVTEAYHHHFPLKIKTTHPSDAPWMTARIKRLLGQRNRLFYMDSTRYRSMRNLVIREINSAKKSYYPRKIQHLKQTNNSEWYTRVRDLCGLNRQSSPLSLLSHLPADKAAEEINSHFASICQSLPELDTTRLPAYLPAPSPPPIVHEYEVLRKLQSFKTKRSTTPVDLPMKMYKEFAHELATPITSIINASLSQSKIPSDWKTSFVTPIPKSPNPQSLNDLRPIAITPIPSLICEDFVFQWTYPKIEKHIDPQQFGNVKSCSTSHYLVNFLDFLYKNLERRKTSLAVAFIDFKKAFDLVDHTTILTKAVHLGFPPNLISWIAAFLSNRHQAVRYQGQVSSLQHLTCGVPQGTRMGPLCFLTLINDALHDTPHRWKYVDDCTVGVALDNTELDYTPLQSTLNRLNRWTEQNSVTLNHNKTVVMHVHTSVNDLAPPEIMVGGHLLQVVRSAKLLGVTIDDKLTWKEHIGNMVRAASYRLYMVRRLKTLGAPAEDLLTIYTAFILPKLLYASPAWSSSLTVTQRRQLERIQKRATRLILGPGYSGYQDALTTLGLSTIEAKHQQALRTFADRLLQHPDHRHMLPPDAPPTQRPTRHRNILQPIRARTDRYKHSPVPSMVAAINRADQ